MDITTYASEGRQRYGELADTVATILRAAIDRSGNMRLQEIQRRAKDVESLRKKIGKLNNPPADVELAVKDLGGCRLVFYTNSDVTKFLRAGLIQDNFEIDWDRTKIHHPPRDEPGADELFHSHNYVVRLKPPRIDLPEHAHLSGLWCEVQVQTTLNHAWSEMAHDTIYKKPELNGFGSSLMKSIDERMASIMREHLLPAGFEFQKVVTDFERLSAGKELFDSKPLDALRQSADNNERFDILSRFLDTVLPHYDDIEGTQDEIRRAMLQVVQAARSSPTQAIETPFGTRHGRTAEDVSRRALEVIDQLRYLGEDSARLTWRFLVSLYPGAYSDAERKRILDSVQGLANNDLRVWEVAGPVVQAVIAEELASLSQDELSALRAVVLKAISAMQNLEAEATAFKGDTFTLSRGVVPHSLELQAIRDQCFQILRTLLMSSVTDVERREVLSCLKQRGYVVLQSAPEATVAMVLRDAAKATDLIAELAPTFSFELRQELEHDALWDYRRYVATEPEAAPCADKEACDALALSIQRLRQVLNSEEEFQVFKVLVGYNSVFEPAWEDVDFEVEREDTYRAQQRKAIIAGIDEADEQRWRKTLIRCAGTDATDAATLPPFCSFLRELGEARPQMVLDLIRDDDPLWERFLPDMFKGVEQGGLVADIQKDVESWIGTGTRLSAVVQYLESADPFNVEELIRATRKAIALGDDRAVIFATSAINTRHSGVPGGLWQIFAEAIRYLGEKNDDRWLQLVRTRPKEKSIFYGLPEADAMIVLEVLSPLPRINYRSESVLAAVAADWPLLVIDHLAARVRHSRSRSFSEYESLPSRFHVLQKVLANQIGRLLSAAGELYKEEPDLFSYRGVLLLSNVFPKFTPELNEALLEMARNGSEQDRQLLANVLGRYKSDPSIDELCKEIVARAENDGVFTHIKSAMTTFGVVGGEYGFADAQQRVKDRIHKWLADEREPVRKFAKAFSYQLEQTIASERRSAQLSAEQRKRDRCS